MNETVLGSSRTEGKRLFDSYWQRLGSAAASERKAAYVFVMAPLSELLLTFDFVLNAPEVTSLQIAIRGQSSKYLRLAEDAGYSPDICGYVKADIGLQLSGGEHPNGKVPPPALVVVNNVCSTYAKWAESWEERFGCPVFLLDLPGWRGRQWSLRGPAEGHETLAADTAYVAGQLRELIELAEKVTGRRFDIDRFREHLAHTNRMAELYRALCDCNREVPAPFNAPLEGVTYQGIANLYRGTEEGVRYFETALAELHERIRLRLAAVPDERFRLVLVGTACYSHFRRFVELFSTWGGVFVQSTYMVFAGGGFLPEFRYDLSRPLESFAEQMVRSAYWGWTEAMFDPLDWLAGILEPWQVDGICFHGVKSCRTTSTGLPDLRETLRRDFGVPGLFIQSDLVDPRLWSDAQIKNRVDAFFEALESQKAARS